MHNADTDPNLMIPRTAFREMRDNLTTERDALRTEVERLREALDNIANVHLVDTSLDQASRAMPTSSGVRRAGTPADQERDSSPALVGHSRNDSEQITITLPRHLAAELQTICEDDDSIAGDRIAEVLTDALSREQS